MSIQEYKNLKETLELEIKKSSNVFIVGHNSPNFDSIGSAIGLYRIVYELGKKAYIIVDDNEVMIEPGVKRVLEEYDQEYRFIKKKDLERFQNKKSMLIVTDTNKKSMISVGDKLDTFRNVIVIDHHTENEDTIITNNKYINLEASSASEIVGKLIMLLKIKCGPKVANALLSGISLDTKRFKQNTTSLTHDVAEKLINNGADIDYVNSLFLEEFESYCRISNLIINGTNIKKYSKDLLAPIQVSFTLNRNNPHEIYLKEDCAKAADRMMKFYGIDASIALGYVDEENVHISARSGKKVNVAKIMDAIGGGGTPTAAGCRIKTDDILKLEKQIMKKISVGISDEEEIYEEPKVVKTKQIKKNKKN